MNRLSNLLLKLIKVINIKAGMPTVEEAREKLFHDIEDAKKSGERFLKIIHGYGSTGVGGKLKDTVRKSLLNRKREGIIEHIIFGERFCSIYQDVENILKIYTFLRKDSDYNKKNAGITIVILKKR